MKKLDKYILKSFLTPFLATFFIILFVVIIFMIWQALDKISGKGVGVVYILKFLYYTGLSALPIVLPISTLLASIMALGNLSEHYEFAAIKSAGISFRRMIAPLLIFVLVLSGLNYLSLDYIFPYAQLKSQNLMYNIQKKQPALALIPGTFNTEIPGYSIKFDEKYGEEENLLRNVTIYDLKSNKGNKTIVKAKSGKIDSEEEGKYMTFELYDGYYYQDHIDNKTSFQKRKRVPFSKATFDKYVVNIDVSSFGNQGLDEENKKNNRLMLSIDQLSRMTDSLSIGYKEYVSTKSNDVYRRSQAKELYQKPDSVINKKISLPLLENFDGRAQYRVLSTAVNNVKRSVDNIKNYKEGYKYKRKQLNQYDVERSKRIASSFSCLLLFLIGASLGSLIRKGGFGVPMILAIIIYVAYFFMSDFGRNLAEASTISPILGGWLSTIIFLPLALYFTYRATNDLTFSQGSVLFDNLKAFFGRLLPKRKKATNANNN